MKNAIITILLACFLEVFWPLPEARAYPVTIELEAVVDSVEDYGPDDGYLDYQIVEAARFEPR